jgi:glycosyltransferase involved in cell wall biosynthesis
VNRNPGSLSDRRLVEGSGLFDATWYQERYPDVGGIDPLDHYLTDGWIEGRSPGPNFDGAWYLAAYPDVASAEANPLVHYLRHGISEGRYTRSAALGQREIDPSLPEVSDPVAPNSRSVSDIKATLKERLHALWPSIQADAKMLQNVVNPITPTPRLQSLWESNIICAPAVHTGTVVQKVVTRLPSSTDHLLLIPWLGVSGGSEIVTQRLLTFLRSRYEHGQLAVLAPDAIFDLGRVQRLVHEIPIVALNDVDRTLSASDRAEIVDDVLVNLRPRTVHVINSDAGWDALRQQAGDYARNSNLFVNIYSDIRMRDGAPAGFFWRYLPEVISHLAGIFADNAAVVARAIEYFSLVPQQRTLFSVVPTPIVGMNGEDPGSQCRSYAPTAREHTLWMSRIAAEKRLDVVRAIASRLPERRFSIYGALLPGAVASDFLAWTADMANVDYLGPFSALEALPVDQFDSYLFTTSAEGMPLSVLEAAMLGLPIVAPAIGGIGEFIDEGTGWIIPDAEAVDQFAASLDEIAARPNEAGLRVARAQKRLVERHSWSNFERVLSAVPNYLRPKGGLK